MPDWTTANSLHTTYVFYPNDLLYLRKIFTEVLFDNYMN